LTSTQTIYETEGTYIVTLTAISLTGCEDVASVTIFALPECVVSVPNIFSPNGDNINDDLKVICNQTLKSMSMQIFDRWGKKVVELNDPNQTWDGAGSSEGTYYYILIAEGFNEVFYKLNGHITLSK
jgi:gliding motility-associated-like protein